MTVQLKDITAYLETIAPLRFQEDYDNAGLIWGNPEQEISGALISLDCTDAVIEEALDVGYNLVIAHHPIIFKGIRKFDMSGYVEKSVVRAIKNDVAIYAIHTNLDNVLRHGVNETIARRLGLIDVQPLKTHDKNHLETDFTVGSGVVGSLRQPMEDKSFLEFVKEKMNLPLIKHTDLLHKPIQKVALCGGAGSFLRFEAIKQKADIFISADFKYHEFFDANGQIVLADIGHYESEYFTIELLFELVKKKFPNFAARCTNVITNPVKYL